jgi:hypothetical protein
VLDAVDEEKQEHRQSVMPIFAIAKTSWAFMTAMHPVTYSAMYLVIYPAYLAVNPAICPLGGPL